VVVDHPGHGYAYPIVLDPTFRIITNPTAVDPAVASQLLQPKTSQISVHGSGSPLPDLPACKATVGIARPSRPISPTLSMRLTTSFYPLTNCPLGIFVTTFWFTYCLQAMNPDGT